MLLRAAIEEKCTRVSLRVHSCEEGAGGLSFNKFDLHCRYDMQGVCCIHTDCTVIFIQLQPFSRTECAGEG